MERYLKYCAMGVMFSILMFTASTGATEVRCVLKKTSNKVYMPQVNDPVGYCGIFAFRSLLHQYNCAWSPRTCALPSVLDIISASTKYNNHPSLNSDNLLSALQKNGGVADESCLNYTAFFDSKNNPKRPLSFSAQFLVMAAKKTGLLSDREINELLTTPGNTPRLERLRSRAAQAQTALDNKITQVASRSRCRRGPLPALTAKFARAKNPDHAATLMKSLFEKGHAVKLHLSVLQPDGGPRLAHAVVATNYRQKCCGDICVTEYQIIDSLGHYWAPNVRDGWIEEDHLLKNLDNDLMFDWLEPANTSQAEAPENFVAM